MTDTKPEPRKRGPRATGAQAAANRMATLSMGERREVAGILATKYPDEFEHLLKVLGEAKAALPK